MMHPLSISIRLLLGLISSVSPVALFADWQLNLPEPKSQTAQQIMSLHNEILIICFAIFILVVGLMAYSMVAHSKKRHPQPATFSHSTKMEAVWTVIPVFILIFMAIPSTKVLIDMEDTTASELDILATGYQWKWSYEYLGENVSFFSNLSTPYSQILGLEERGDDYLLEVDKELVLPVGRKVRFLLTSADVIHAWWIADLGVKKDAVPGVINEFWINVDEPGTYRGVCAELCGRGHGFMPIVVRAIPADDFDLWLESKRDYPNGQWISGLNSLQSTPLNAN